MSEEAAIVLRPKFQMSGLFGNPTFVPTCCNNPQIATEEGEWDDDTQQDVAIGCASCASDWFTITHVGSGRSDR